MYGTTKDFIAKALLRKHRDGRIMLQLETVLQSDNTSIKTDTHVNRTEQRAQKYTVIHDTGGKTTQWERLPLQ